MTGKKIITYSVIIALNTPLYNATALANISSDMNSFWTSSGGIVNTTSAGSYHSQAGGYVTLGGMQARTPVRSTNLATISLPSVRSGCSGIDIFSGGFSFINSSQLTAFVKSIASNAVGYFFQMGLETLSPTLAGVMSSLRDLAQKVNSSNINSCQQAKALVGSVLAKDERISQTICEDIATSQGIFKDRAAANHGCSSGGRQTSIIKGATGALKETIPWNTNIAWKIIRKNPTFASNDELAELAMSITGTIIPQLGNNDRDTKSIRRYASLGVSAGDKNDIVNALMYGSSAQTGTEIYKCDETNKCLNPGIAKLNVDKTTAFVPKIRVMLSSIQNQITSGTCTNTTNAGRCFSNEEHELIENTSFPLYKILNAYGVYGQSVGASPTSYADIVAFDMVFNYIKNISYAVTKETHKDISNSEITKEYITGLQRLQVRLNEIYAKKTKKLSMTLDMIQRIENIDARVRSDLSSTIRNNLNYENSFNNGK